MFENSTFRLSVAALLLLAVSLACSLTSTTVDCNVPDLIAAINNANAHPAHSTLELDPGCTYTLTAVDNTAIFEFNGSTFDHGENGLPQITTQITINGNNATIIRESGASHFRIFFIKSTGSLTINDLTLQNGFADGTYPGGGSASPGSGGAIYNSSSTLEVNNSTLQVNQGTAMGGSVFGIGTSATYINGSTITDNTAPNGGGIYIYHEGLLSVDDSEISGNISGAGGGINLEHGAELIINDSLIASNHSSHRGGGIFKGGGPNHLPTTITGTIFQGNTADWSGGGVFIWRTPLTISGSQFINNHADEYGGGLGYQDHSTETVQISNTTFDGNSAVWDGGAIHFSGELMTINNCTIQNNTAENGGGIHNGLAIDPRYINRADTTLIITSSTVRENIASGDGGGAFNEGAMTCGESNFVANESSFQGGGIHNTGQVEVVGCTFEKNKTGEDGGGINSDNIAEIRDSDFTNNTSMRGGGGIYNNGVMTVSQSTLSGNEASTLGGGIHNKEEIKVQDSTFEGNLAHADGGGLNTYGMAAVTGSTFAGNTAFRGGGLASVGGDTTLTNNTFFANMATDSGGGLFNMGPLIGDTSSGGAMQASHITVAYNSAPAGGGIATTGGGVRIKNSIVALNPSGADCLTSTVDFSSIGENIDSDGSCPGFTLKEDPLLDVLANYGGPTETHALKPDSPAIDAAPDCTTVSGAAVSVDQRGQPRPGGPICDLGAYEDDVGNPVPTFPHVIFRNTLDCRLEPASSSAALTSFQPDDTAEVIGRNINLTWFQVAPDELEDPCWVWVGGVEFIGKLESVEIIPSKSPVEEEKPEEEGEEPSPSQPGCTVRDLSGALSCQVPCPPNAVPGDPCTP